LKTVGRLLLDLPVQIPLIYNCFGKKPRFD